MDSAATDGEVPRVSPGEALLRACIEALEAGGSAAVEEVLRRHPGQAEAVRSCLRNLEAMGLIGDETRRAVPKLPERLGDFRLLERLGGGAMGVVNAAEQISLRRRVALKLLRPEQILFPGSRERFRREVAAAARLHHPGIVPIYAVGEEGGIPYFAMDLLEGRTVAEIIEDLDTRRPANLDGRDLAAAVARRSGTASGAAGPAPSSTSSPLFEGSWVEACLRIVFQVAGALEHSHQNGIIHRDVKSSNVMITADGRAVLVDFGLAAQEEATPITMSGMQPGSLPYMSPEQLRGERGLDPRTDIYSLGVSLYEMLALRRPFQGDTVEEVRAKILHGHPPALRSLNRQVAWDVETVCLTAMEPDRSRRYASAGGFARDLENLLRLRPIGARRASLPLRIRRASQRRPVPALVLAVIVLALAGLAVAHGWRRTRDRANVEQLLHEARALEGEGRLEEAIERTGGALAVDAVHPEAVALRDRLQSISRERAAHDLTEIRRLADSKLLRDLKVEADGLWPARPERASSFEGWLKRAQDLRGRLNGHRGALEALEPEGQTAADIATQWQRDVLRELVSGLEGLAVLVDEVRSGLETARTIAPLTVSGDSARKMWAETAADVASLPIYGGLRLEPQIGLLPIGRDPRSGLWEFHHPETGSCPERQGPGDMPLIGPDTGIIFVLLPGGNAQCGSWPVSPEHPEGTPHADPWHRRSEAPVHEVRLEPFFLAKHEMTQGQWFRATGRQPSVRRTFGASPMAAFPVENVAWAECVRVLARFELLVPTEIQWEYACRAGTATVFSTGDSIESLIGSANVRDDTLPRTADGSPADGFIEVAPVGRLHPNRWGLHDMHGNLWEWCRESSDDFVSHYRDHAPAPGDGWRPVKATGFRICRGGSFDDPVRFARSAVRSEYREDASSIEIGVRPLLPLRR